MAQYCIFRAAKLQRGHGRHSVGKAIRHLEKHIDCADISRPERSHLNRSQVFYKNLSEEIKGAIELHNFNSSRSLRSDAAVAFEMIFTFSPEMEEKVNSHDFYEKIKQFCHEEFRGAKPLRVDFHADETVSHFHVVLLATTPELKISAREHLGNKAHLSQLQDRFAELCKPLGLQRGKRYHGQKKKPSHVALKTYKAKQIEDIKFLEQMKKKATAELQQELCR